MIFSFLKSRFNQAVRNSKEIVSLKDRLNILFSQNENNLLFQQDAILAQYDYLLRKNKNNKKVIYTCLTGGYDDLPLHLFLNPEYDYICYTDSEKLLNYKNYGAWEIRGLEKVCENPTMSNRWHKTHPHILFQNSYTESIYIDSNIIVTGSLLFNEIEAKQNLPVVIPRHNYRNCVYKEIDEVLKTVCGILKKVNPESVLKMKNFLETNDFPKDYGLNENNILYRKHNEPAVAKMMEDWWGFIENYCPRDQLSLCYVLWKNNIKPDDISITNARESNNYIVMEHKKQKRYL